MLVDVAVDQLPKRKDQIVIPLDRDVPGVGAGARSLDVQSRDAVLPTSGESLDLGLIGVD